MDMPLPRPFADLADRAPLCTEPATAEDVLREAGSLLRSEEATHLEPEACAAWFSGVVGAVLSSPAGKELAGGPVSPTGALARGELLPGLPVRWVRLGRGDDSGLTRLLAAAGLDGSASDGDPVDLMDAGHFRPDGPDRVLLERAVDKLPGTEALELFADVARWAAGERAALRVQTVDRLVAGTASGLLSIREEEILAEGWRAALGRRLALWRNPDQTDGSPPEAVQSATDAVCRIAERFNVTVATEGGWS